MTNQYTRKDGLSSDNVRIEGAEIAVDLNDPTGGKIELDTDRVLRTDSLDEEKFYRDILTIVVNDAATENDAPFAEVTVNGQYRCIPRGTPVDVPRAHVAVLAQAKVHRVKQDKITNTDGSMSFQEKIVTSLMYPFSVIADPNQRQGSAWLRQILSNPV